MVGIQTARIGQHPESALSDALGLRPDTRPGPLEGKSIGTDSHHCNPRWPVAANLTLQPETAAAEFSRSKLRRRSSTPCHQVGNAELQLEQNALLPGTHQAGSKSSEMQRGPETISRPGKVVPGGSGVESRIDPTEQNFEVGTDQIGNPFPCRRDEVRLARPTDVSRRAARGVQGECAYRLGPSHRRRSLQSGYESGGS